MISVCNTFFISDVSKKYKQNIKYLFYFVMYKLQEAYTYFNALKAKRLFRIANSNLIFLASQSNFIYFLMFSIYCIL